ncbi:hypothetical protein ICW40_16715 [Actinotalea ferrariae]|nr:hypothetical protein [Actinotalea ferrariae]
MSAPAVPLAPLVTASATGQLLANVGPIAIAALTSPAEQALSGNFVAAVTIARIPLFFFAAVQAVFLPSLAALVALGRRAELVATMRRALLATTALGVVGTVGVHLLGPWALGLVYGPEFAIDRLDLDLIAVSGGVFMLAQVLAQGLLAHGADRAAAVGWSVGLVAVPLALLLPLDPATRVATALCVGSAVAVAGHAVGLRAALRGTAPDQPDRPPREIRR